MTPLTAVATREHNVSAPAVTSEQLDLIRRTIAQGATDDELKLYLFDCARQGVHPLDKLVHFTKRSGKYTPITSIDFMRIRAADTGEMAGSDEPLFVSEGTAVFSATVTVFRMTQGQRFAYTATARWSEYKPDQNDFMWRKMPHTMLGKCAEALALRKGFPRQLAGLYAKEELDQADAPKLEITTAEPVIPIHDEGRREVGVASVDAPGTIGLPAQSAVPPGAVRIVKVGPGKAGAEGEITFDSGETLLTWKKAVVAFAKLAQEHGTPVIPGFKTSASGNRRLDGLREVAPEVSEDEIPF